MNRWRHSLCQPCWEKDNPGRIPVLVNLQSLDLCEVCCGCGTVHNSGIFVRRNPAMLLCRGEGGHHVDEE